MAYSDDDFERPEEGPCCICGHTVPDSYLETCQHCEQQVCSGCRIAYVTSAQDYGVRNEWVCSEDHADALSEERAGCNDEGAGR